MNGNVSLYKKPLITATVFLIAGIALLAGGMYLADATDMSDYYALCAFGVIFLIVAVVVFAVYGGMERKFQAVINSCKLIDYTLDDGHFNDVAKRTGDEIKENNKMVLAIMLFFCILFAIASPFVVEDGYIISYIMIGLAIFLTLAKIIITHYRVNKVKKGVKRVILSQKGAYVCGEFHCWNIPGSSLSEAKFVPNEDNSKMGHIRIEYNALTLPGITVYSFVVPIPKDLEDKVAEIISKLTVAR